MSLNHSWRLCVVAALAAAIGGLGAGLANTASAQGTSARARPTAIAVVSISKVLANLKEREDKEAELRDLGRQREDKVNELGQRAKTSQDDLAVIPRNTKDWREKREEAVRLQAQFELEKKIAESTLGEQQKNMQLALFNKILDSVKAYAEREGYDLVLTNDSGVEIPPDLTDQQFLSAVTGRRVVYASDSIDITDEVALAMNNEYKAP